MKGARRGKTSEKDTSERNVSLILMRFGIKLEEIFFFSLKSPAEAVFALDRKKNRPLEGFIAASGRERAHLSPSSAGLYYVVRT